MDKMDVYKGIMDNIDKLADLMLGVSNHINIETSPEQMDQIERAIKDSMSDAVAVEVLETELPKDCLAVQVGLLRIVYHPKIK